MKIVITCIGRIGYEPFREAIERYAKRIVRYAPFEIKELPDVKSSRSLAEDQQKRQEGASILGSLLPGDYMMLLDERGKEHTSREFAKFISDKMVNLPGRLVLVIGGPYGFSKEVYSRADGMLSLSKMTLPHEMARLVLAEQVYRAMTILRGEPYHHD